MFSSPFSSLKPSKLLKGALGCLLLSGFVIMARHLGLLENAELWVYDQMIQLRSSSGPDPRILIVAIDDASIAKLQSDKISDQDLTKALKILAQYNPRVVTVDILRDVPIGKGRKELLAYLQTIYQPLNGIVKPIIFPCQLPSSNNPVGLAPPPVLDTDTAVGFADVEVDSTDIVRRLSISSIPVPGVTTPKTTKTTSTKSLEPKCKVPFSLGFLTSLAYLQNDNITITQNDKNLFKLGSVIFKPPGIQAGSYRKLDPTDYQVILDYRLRHPAEVVSLGDLLDGKVKVEQVKGKAVLIGYTTKDDIYITPYGITPGVFIHAQLLQQILANVLDNRPLLWYWNSSLEGVWIIFWGIIGGAIALTLRKSTAFYLGEIGSIVVVGGMTFFLFTQQGWLPLLPTILSLTSSAIAVRLLCLDETLTISSSEEESAQRITRTVLQTKLEELEPSLERSTIFDAHQTRNSTRLDSVSEKPVEISTPSTGGRKEFRRVDPYLGLLLGEGERYKIEKHLGGGGMGKVFLASDTKLRGRTVAVKVLTTYESSDKQSLIKRFEREVQLTAPLQSPNIVKVSDFGLTPEESVFAGAPFYVMEYLTGQTLTERIEEQGGRLSLMQAIPIVRQICAGLREAHEQGTVHRDLKPDNIFLVSAGPLGELVKILDFGIAKIVSEDENAPKNKTITRDGSFLGTYRYASPEQCLGQTSEIDQRTDIYSLGIMFYEMLSGTNPYNLAETQDTQGYWITSHIGKQALPLRTQPGCEDMSLEIERIINKCLEKFPKDRFNNIKELEQDLNEVNTILFNN